MAKRALVSAGQVVGTILSARRKPTTPSRLTRFDTVLDALNRLPRPAFAFGAIGLFAFALAAPDAFATRMTALSAMPDQLWWLLGGVVSFHFGAREAYYHRAHGPADPLPDPLPGADDPNPARDALTPRPAQQA